MKFKILSLLLITIFLASCKTDNDKKTGTDKKEEPSVQIKGTWALISATAISKGQRTFTNFTKDQRMIKIINDDHFAFLRHDLKLNKEGKSNFDAGGGRYTLKGDQYTESLDYYNDKNWEGKTFNFTVKILNDTLIQTGVEKVEAAGVDRTITERYLRVKDN